MIKLNKAIFITIGILMVSALSTFGQMPEIPSDLKEMVGAALIASKESLSGTAEHKGKVQKQYDEVMSQIAERADAKLVAGLKPYAHESIEAKIIVLAHYKKQESELHDNIRKVFFTRYVKEGAINPFGRAPEVMGEFREEKYRRAWEYYIFSCGYHESPTLAERKPIEALAIIANPKSLVTLKPALKLIYETDVDDRNDLEWRIANLLSAVSVIDGPGSLDFILTSLRELKADEYFEKSYHDKDIYDSAFSIFAMMPKAQLAEWKQAMESYPKDQLNQQEQKLFERSLATQGH